MAINKAMRLALKTLSYQELDLKRNYKLKRQLTKAAHPYIKPLYQIWDHKISLDDHDIPVRIFFPSNDKSYDKALIFFHGGGWVIGDIDSYTAVCSNMAKQTGCLVISVDYRLAPEYPFPAGLMDCYAVAREVILNCSRLNLNKDNIYLIGDSAGGNLAAAVSLMARDRKEFMPAGQILIYPSTASDHSENSPYPSVREFGTDYLLTAKRINDYMELYISSGEDLKNPYLAPILCEDLSGQPRTLIITAEYDPLRDEAEIYGRRLAQAGNQVQVYRMKDALHGFFSLPKHFVHVKRSYELINKFLNEGK